MPRPAKPVEMPEIDLSVLSKQQCEIYRMCKEGKTIAEIAKALGISEGSIYQQLARIRAKALRDGFKDKMKSTIHTEDLELDDEEYAHLTSQQARVVYLKKKGKRVKDIAQIMGLSPGTVSQYLFRAKYGRGNKASPVITRYIKSPPEKGTDL